MNPAIVPILTDLLEAYYDLGEFIALGELFDVAFDVNPVGSEDRRVWFDLATQLVQHQQIAGC